MINSVFLSLIGLYETGFEIRVTKSQLGNTTLTKVTNVLQAKGKCNKRFYYNKGFNNKRTLLNPSTLISKVRTQVRLSYSNLNSVYCELIVIFIEAQKGGTYILFTLLINTLFF